MPFSNGISVSGMQRASHHSLRYVALAKIPLKRLVPKYAACCNASCNIFMCDILHAPLYDQLFLATLVQNKTS